MSIEESLFWVLQEDNIDNCSLFLPADTPLGIGQVKSERLYKMAKEQHKRQIIRLILQQVEELEDYQRDFAKENSAELELITAPEVVACQMINGTTWFNENSQALSMLIQEESKCMRADSLSIYQSQKLELQKKAKEDIDIEERRATLQDIIRKTKYVPGFEELEKFHKYQYQALLQYQKIDLVEKNLEGFERFAIRSESRAVTHEEENLSVQKHNKSNPDALLPPRKKAKKSKSSSEKKRKRREREEALVALSHSAGIDPAPSSSKQIEYIKLPPNAPASLVAKLQQGYNGQKVQIDQLDNQQKDNKVKTNISLPNNNNNSKTSPAISIGVPTVTSSSTLKLLKPNKEAENKSKGSSDNGKKAGPLFHHQHKTAICTLMDRGSMVVKNKPPRVIIITDGVSKKYGDPKDYDDAMNSSYTRHDNPVHKRILNGKSYLFYKTEREGFFNVGPVDSIQPLIHKFFLNS